MLQQFVSTADVKFPICVLKDLADVSFNKLFLIFWVEIFFNGSVYLYVYSPFTSTLFMPTHLSLAFPNLQNGEHRFKSLHYARHQTILKLGVDLSVHFTVEAIAPSSRS